MTTSLLLIGGRSKAIEAAKSLGCDVYLIADFKTPKRLLKDCTDFYQLNFPAKENQILDAAKALFNNNAPDSVIAVSEQGVLPAAWCRQYWHLSGLSVLDAEAALVKSKMKQRFIASNLPCWPTYAVGSADEACDLANRMGYPLVVKALASSGSRGFRIIPNRSRLRRVVKAMLEIESYGGVGLEPLVNAREFSLELLVKNSELLFFNFTDYIAPGAINLLPAKLASEVKDEALNLGKEVLKAFHFTQGMAHIEFYLKDNQLWLGEINARPPGGGLMELISGAYEFDAWQAVIASELISSKPKTRQKAKCYLGNWVIHPGAGVVRSIRGIHDIAAHDFTVDFHHKMEVGGQVKTRSGTGESVGLLTMKANHYKPLKDALLWSRETLNVELDSLNQAAKEL